MISNDNIKPSADYELTDYIKCSLKDKKQTELFDSIIVSGQKRNSMSENFLHVYVLKIIFLTKKKLFNDSNIDQQQIYWIFFTQILLPLKN